jgi:tRNA nucleotidyltransferase (CCA-adding enzyme)
VNSYLDTRELHRSVASVVSPTYLVGGAVRDLALGRAPKDYDYATSLSPDEVEARVRAQGKRAYTVGKRFGTIGFKVDGKMVEVTTFRTEKYTKGSRKPSVEYVTDVHSDLARRDFTFNAMAITEDGRLLDPHKGIDDLHDGVIRTVGHPTVRFKEDALRMLRACRFVAQHGFTIEDNTLKSMQRNAHLILNVSRERWGMELDKILVAPWASYGLKALSDSRLLGYMLPEVERMVGYDQRSRFHNLPLWEHTLGVVDGVPAETELRWAALLHDVGKPSVRQEKVNPSRLIYPTHERLSASMVDDVANRLKWSNQRRDIVRTVVRYHLDEDSPLKAADDAAK